MPKTSCCVYFFTCAQCGAPKASRRVNQVVCDAADCRRVHRRRRYDPENYRRTYISRKGKTKAPTAWNPSMPMRRAGTYVERLLSRYEIADSGCWTWTGSIAGGTGYGQIAGPDGRTRPAHRAMYEHHRGPIAPGLVIDHLCENRSCVNPDHLQPVTYSENNRRRFHRDQRAGTPQKIA